MRRGLVTAPLLAALLLSACTEPVSEESGKAEPFTLEPIHGTDLTRVILTTDAAERVGIETTLVTARGRRKAIPDSAVWIDVNGDEWVYTSPEPLVFVRAAISVDRYRRDTALLSEGPAIGTEVVSVGVAELIGSEFGI
jgi:hypothetical protein